MHQFVILTIVIITIKGMIAVAFMIAVAARILAIFLIEQKYLFADYTRKNNSYWLRLRLTIKKPKSINYIALLLALGLQKLIQQPTVESRR